MTGGLVAVWLRVRWTLAKVLTPVVVLSCGWIFFGGPQLASIRSIEAELLALNAAEASRPQLEARIDSLHGAIQILVVFQKELKDRPVQNIGLDSLRKSAEKSGLTINDMTENIPTSKGYSSKDQMDLAGDFDSLLAWIASLDSLNPGLQILQMHWSNQQDAKGVFRVSSLQIGHLAPTPKVDSGTVNATEWIARAKSWMRKNSSPPLRTIRGNPLLGHQPEPVARPTVAPPPKPVSPTPKLRLVGLVAGRLATVDYEGSRRMLRIGDPVGDWVVASITAMSLTLENSGRSQSYGMK
jgi:hypothetical protein